MATMVADNDIVLPPTGEDPNSVRFLANVCVGCTEKDTARERRKDFLFETTDAKHLTV